MLVTITTIDLTNETEVCEVLECDITDYKASRWLTKHLVWAMSQGYGVQIEVKKC